MFGVKTSPDRAERILGSACIPLEVSTHILGIQRNAGKKIPYHERTLAWAARKNKTGEAWKLVYITGISVRELIETVKKRNGLVLNSPPLEFALSYSSKKRMEELHEATCSCGYRLINFKPTMRRGYIPGTVPKQWKLLHVHEQRTPLPVLLEALTIIVLCGNDTLDDISYAVFPTPYARIQIRYRRQHNLIDIIDFGDTENSDYTQSAAGVSIQRLSLTEILWRKHR